MPNERQKLDMDAQSSPDAMSENMNHAKPSIDNSKNVNENVNADIKKHEKQRKISGLRVAMGKYHLFVIDCFFCLLQVL